MSTRTPLAVRRFTLVALVLPTIVTAVAVIVQALALPHVPDPIAIHWDASGTPNGFAAPWVSLALTAAIGLGIPLLVGLSGLNGLRRGDRGTTYRLLGATSLGVSTLLGALTTSLFVMQVGIEDASAAPDLWGPGLASLIAAIALGVAGWLLQPHEPYRVSALDASAGNAAITLGDTERVVWLQRTQIARSGIIVLGIALLVLVAATILVVLEAPESGVSTGLVILTVFLLALLLMTCAFHVRVDEHGLSVISVAGFPRIHVPLAEIARAEPVSVNPMGEFGGWGLRWAPGGSGFGVVLRTGPGIRVTRTNGKAFTVTTDDAETGAALLNALGARAVR